MKKATDKPPYPQPDEALSEYDFAGKHGVRGKYYQAYRQGHAVKVREDDGSVDVQYFTLEDGAIMLEPDVREYFPTSESVNQALRSLIKLIPARPMKNEVAGEMASKTIRA